VTAKQIMLFTHASLKDKTHIQMGESSKSNLTVSYFSTNNKEQKYTVRQWNTQDKTIQKWDAGMTDNTFVVEVKTHYNTFKSVITQTLFWQEKQIKQYMKGQIIEKETQDTYLLL
jgi:hypothetical protein